MNPNESLPKKGGSLRFRAILITVLALCVLIALNYALTCLPAKWTKWDATGTGLTDLAPETDKFLSKLDTDVTIYWLCEGGKVDQTLIGDWFPLLLSRYEEANKHIRVVTITDAKAQAQLLADLGAEGLSNHGLVVASGHGDEHERTMVYEVAELFTYSSQFINQNLNNGEEMELTLEEMGQMMQLVYSYYQIDITQFPIYNHSSLANAKLTSAIDYVTADIIPRAYLLTGYRGSSMTDTLKIYLGALNEGMEEWDISKETAIPADAGVVILHAPTEDITETQAAIINAYLARGGSLVMTTSPNTHVENCPNLQSLTTPFGLSALPGIVFDAKDGYYAAGTSTSTLTPVVNSQHEFYELYSSGSYALQMPWSHAIGIEKTLPTGVSATPIMGTSTDAVRKAAGGVTETLGDAAQCYVGVEASREVTVSADGTATTAHIMWFGSTEAFTAETAAAARGNYYYLALGAQLIREPFVSDYESVGRVRLATDTLQSMGDVMGFSVMAVITIVLPVALLATGLVVWVKRRKRQ